MKPYPSPYDRRPSMQSRAIGRALRLGFRPFVSRLPGHPVSLRTARTAADAAARLIRSNPGVRVEQLVDARTGSDSTTRPVVGEWVSPLGPRRGAGAILYLHGGGYVACSPRTHRPITMRLAVDSALPVLVPRYRLAPEHPFPAALFDALDAYRFLLARGIPGCRIVIAGDSAGGHLAASVAGEICRADLPCPAGVVLYSPWVDLTCTLSSKWAGSCRDPYVSPAAARLAGQLYVGTGDFDDPRLSLLSCQWSTPPPFFIQVGGNEVLRAEAEELTAVLKAAGAECELQVWPGQMHVFQMLNQVLPEARAAILETARFVRTAIAAAAAGGEAA